MNEEIQHIKTQVARLMNSDNQNLILRVLDLLNKMVDKEE